MPVSKLKLRITHVLIALCGLVCSVHGLLDEGKWDDILPSGEASIYKGKSLFKGSQIFIKLNCDSKFHNGTIIIEWVVVQTSCWDFEKAKYRAQQILMSTDLPTNGTDYVRSLERTYRCNDHIILDETELKKDEKSLSRTHPIYVTPKDGLYVLSIKAISNVMSDLHLNVHTEMKSSHGYLSAADWPLLPFYGFMCILYVLFGVIWLIVCFMQWRDLLRVQFWIGGVIFLGMLEKATFYAEYQSINNTGTRMQGAMLFAEWISCAKRTLARMLVVIVSLGFGIVKPRLGAALHRVVGAGMLYFFLAASESYVRVTRPQTEQTKDLLVASVPLAVLDSAICWWIFTALVNTTRTLRLRRNEVKLSLYRHFTNTLIFSVVASVVFMLYSIKNHKMISCILVWKDLWLEEAYWHILFSAVLLAIMILWRPTNNNQRYAFVPLLETGDDDDEEEDQLVNDAYGVKVRLNHLQQRPSSPKTHSIEDDIKWLEENVTSDPTLPVLDSDEELVNTRFEVSKMQ